jgi:hypothetical protein
MCNNDYPVKAIGYFIPGGYAGLMGAMKAALPVAIQALRKSDLTVDLGMANHLEHFAAMIEGVHNEVLCRKIQPAPEPTDEQIAAHEQQEQAREA